MNTPILGYLAKLIIINILESNISKTDAILKKIVKTNIVQNMLFIIICFIDILSASYKILIIYYVVSICITLVTLLHLLKKIDALPIYITALVPNMISQLRQYIILIMALFVIQVASIVFALDLDLWIYISFGIITVRLLRADRVYSILYFLSKLFGIRGRHRFYATIFIIENLVTLAVFFYII